MLHSVVNNDFPNTNIKYFTLSFVWPKHYIFLTFNLIRMILFNEASLFFQSMLFDYAGFFFVPLSSRLVNDDSASCRKLTALVIKSLLGKVLTRSENNVRRVCRCSSR